MYEQSSISKIIIIMFLSNFLNYLIICSFKIVFHLLSVALNKKYWIYFVVQALLKCLIFSTLSRLNLLGFIYHICNTPSSFLLAIQSLFCISRAFFNVCYWRLFYSIISLFIVIVSMYSSFKLSISLFISFL